MNNKPIYAIRPWKMTDSRRLAENANNINIWKNVRDQFPHPYTENDAKAFIRMAQSKKNVEDFAVIVNDEAVGGIGYIQGNDIERLNAEIGYWIGERYWGKGIISDALKDVIAYIFTYTDIIRLFTSVLEHNIASTKVLEKNGFRRIGTQTKAAIKNGQIIDMYSYELIKDDFIR